VNHRTPTLEIKAPQQKRVLIFSGLKNTSTSYTTPSLAQTDKTTSHL
jgi:hypothetical protein